MKILLTEIWIKDEEVWEAAKLSESDKFINLLLIKKIQSLEKRAKAIRWAKAKNLNSKSNTKNPEILILDEATSAVDNETEAAIQGLLIP